MAVDKSQDGIGVSPAPNHARASVEYDALLTVDDSGMVCHCDGATELLFDYRCTELVGQHVSLVLPELKESELMRDGQVSPRLRFLAHIGHAFKVVARNGQVFPGDLILLKDFGNSWPARLRLIVRAAPVRTTDMQRV